MKKKINNKLFTIGLGTIATLPLLANCLPMNVVTNTTTLVQKATTNNNEQKTHHEACTITYFGKNCTADHVALIARATDSGPRAFHLKLKHYKADEKAKLLIVGKNGLRYQMPDHTYAYTSCPMSSKTSDDPLWGNELWENNGINEMGVCVTCTLTCATNDAALEHDPFVPSGIGEELLTAIITPQAATARQAMEIAAAAIDKYGNQDANIIMASDQNEAWLMEMYNGHQYCAVKLPDDKVCVAGNEFILDSLHDLGINEQNKDQNCILSPKLLDFAKEHGFDKYIDGTTEAQKDVFHLDLFKTYARPLTWQDEHGVIVNTDSDHMRTWRGYSLFDRSIIEKYSSSKKYAPFFVPKDEHGNVRKDLNAHDVMEIYRDEYDEILDEKSDRYDPYFVETKKQNHLRTIAVEHTRAVHIMGSDPSLPRALSAKEWYTPSSGNYTPFIPLNSGMTSVEGEYGFYPSRFDFDENCSSVLYRELNKLAWYDRKNYGYPLQEYWRDFEDIYCHQMEQVVQDAARLSSINDAKDIITNFDKHVRDITYQAIKDAKNDLMWHIMDQPSSSHPTFIPLVDLESYVKVLGWKNYKFDGSTVTFDRNNVNCKFEISDGKVYAQGKLYVDGTIYNLKDSVRNNKVYVDAITLKNAIRSKSEIQTVNINDYKSSSYNYLAWLIPVVFVGAVGIAVGTYFLVKKIKKDKAKANISEF